MSLLKLNNISQSFGDAVVLKEINVALDQGEMIGLVGPSGSGKSTILNIAGCIQEPTGGDVWLDDHPVNRLNPKQKTLLRRSCIGFIFQHFQLIESMTVRENIELPLMLLKKSKPDRQQQSQQMMDALDIGHIAHHPTTAISGGQKQRTAIARALIKRPKLIIADEPTASLDKKNSNTVFKILKELLEKYKIGLIMASHDQHALEQMHRNIYLDKGEIVSSVPQQQS